MRYIVKIDDCRDVVYVFFNGAKLTSIKCDDKIRCIISDHKCYMMFDIASKRVIAPIRYILI